MKPQSRRPPLPSVALGLLIVCLSSASRAEIIERVVAKVNGEIITLSDFVARQVAAAQNARIGEDRLEGFLRQNNARILQDAVDDLLLVQRAGELGMRLRPEFVDEIVENIRKENNLASEEALLEQLRREGMTLEGLKRNIERSFVRRQVLSREVDSKAAVTEAEVRAEYEARKGDYKRPATVKLQEILIPAGEGAAVRAADVARRAGAGEDFAALAREHSASPTAPSGGDLGVLASGEINPELERVAFALAPGEVSKPLPTGEGYRILKVQEKKEAGVVPFEEARGEIRERLYRHRWDQAYDGYMESLRKTAIIDVRVREVPLQVDLPPEASPLLDPPLPDRGPATPPPSPGGAPAAGEDEFVTSPQMSPERIAPEERPPAPPSPAPVEEEEKDEEAAPPPL